MGGVFVVFSFTGVVTGTSLNWRFTPGALEGGWHGREKIDMIRPTTKRVSRSLEGFLELGENVHVEKCPRFLVLGRQVCSGRKIALTRFRGPLTLWMRACWRCRRAARGEELYWGKGTPRTHTRRCPCSLDYKPRQGLEKGRTVPIAFKQQQ